MPAMAWTNMKYHIECMSYVLAIPKRYVNIPDSSIPNVRKYRSDTLSWNIIELLALLRKWL